MSVFLRQQKLTKGVYLSFIESFYDSSKKNVSQKVIKKIGYLDDLSKSYTDPIAFFQEEAKKLSIASSKKYQDTKVEKIPRARQVKNLGYFIIKNIFDSFKLDEVFDVVTYNRKFQFSLASVFRFLTYSQIICPASKSKEFKKIDQYFDNFTFSEDQLDTAIQLIGKNEDVIKEYIQLQLKKMVKLNTSTSYFDGTNFYFEIDKETEELKRGPEKNGRHDPILGLGLLMDANGIPINYTTFPGNVSEQPELHKNVQELKKKEHITGRTIITADKGLNSGDNMFKAVQNGDGYVIGQKVRGGSKDCIAWVLQDDDNDSYQISKNDQGEIVYKIKHEVNDYPVDITSPLNGQKATVTLKQKRVVFWSKDYADKASFDRLKIIERAKQIVANPKAFLKSTVGDAASYIKEINYDSNGEIITKSLEIDQNAISKASALDGYYLIVTSEVNLDDKKIIDIYRGLWEIEESFSIIKGVLKARPFFCKTTEGIHSHVLICFFSLLILRILQKVTLKKVLSSEQISAIEESNKKKRKYKIKYQKMVEYPVTQIVSFIRDFNVLQMGDNYYPTQYHDFIPFIEERYSIILDKKILTQEDLNKIFNSVPQHKTSIIN